MRIVALAGVALILGALGLKMTVLKPAAVPTTIRLASTTHPAARFAVVHARHAVTPRVDQTLPAALRRELAGHPVVVAVLYAPVPGDSNAVAAARAGARLVHAGFAVLDVRDETVARAVATKLPGSSDPSVLVVRRPGTISVLLPGYVDQQVVAEAAAEARP